MDFGLCPIAEKLQSSMIQLKTNFETLEEALFQARTLKETLSFFQKKTIPLGEELPL